MLVFNAITLYWVGGWSSDDIFLKIGGVATVLIHPLFFLIPLLLICFVAKVTKPQIALIAFPFLWTGFEYAHNEGQLAFPWIELGNTETYNLDRIQYIDYTGVHGITFLICVISVLLYYLAYNISIKKWAMWSKKSVSFTAIIIILIIAPNIYSHFYMNNNFDRYFSTSDSSKIIRATIIQPNVDPFKKWSGNRNELVDSYIYRLNESITSKPDLIVLHETAVPYYFLEDYNFENTEKFLEFVNYNKKLLLMGIPHLQYYSDSLTAPKDSKIMSNSKRRYGTYNSAILIEPNKNMLDFQIHKKVKLVPISERTPYQDVFPFLKNIVSWGVGISSWQAGDSIIIFEINNHSTKIKSKFAALICFESVFSDYVSDGVKRGAEFLVIITNDGWFGKSSGPIQHQQFGVLRAIENRKWIIRAAQTGISCFIDPLGNAYSKIPAYTEKTFYSEYGDIIGIVSYYLAVLSFFMTFAVFIFERIRRKTNQI
jgi:apolipoprotein N-acyltransferase